MEPQYRRVTRFVSEQVWALRESTLDTIVDVLRMRAAGIELSKEEIQARVGALVQPAPQTRGSIAVLPLYGIIAPKMNMMIAYSGGTSLEAFMAKFRQYRDDSSISAIVVDVDSPGGSAFMLPETWKEIYESREAKPMTAVVNPTCGSAALFIASAFADLACTPSGEIGSLGCYCVHEDWSKANEMMGIKPTYVYAGDYKVELNPDEPLADDTKAYLQSLVDACYEDFVRAVAKGRDKTPAYVRENFGQGRMLLAKDAKAVGLVDRIASLDEVLMKLVGRRGRSTAAVAAELVGDATEETVMARDLSADTPIRAAADDEAPTADPQAVEDAPPAMALAEEDPAFASEREATARELELLERL